MVVSSEHKAKVRARKQHLYAPRAVGRLHEQEERVKKLPTKPLPRGATLPSEPDVVPIYEHSADRPARRVQ